MATNSKKAVEQAPAQEMTAEQAANIADLNAKQAPPAEKAAPTYEELKAAYLEINAKYTDALANDDDAKMAEYGKQTLAAKRALDEFKNKQAAERAQAEMTAKKTAAMEMVQSVFGVTAEQINAYVAQDAKNAEAKQPTLKDALALIFGGKTVYAKEGQTGASIEKGERKPGAGKEILDLWNDGNGLSAADIIAKGYSRGTTHAVILERQRELGLKPAKG